MYCETQGRKILDIKCGRENDGTRLKINLVFLDVKYRGSASKWKVESWPFKSVWSSTLVQVKSLVHLLVHKFRSMAFSSVADPGIFCWSKLNLSVWSRSDPIFQSYKQFNLSGTYVTGARTGASTGAGCGRSGEISDFQEVRQINLHCPR
jgi:hypothetical protein